MKIRTILLCFVVVHLSYVDTAPSRRLVLIHRACKRKFGVTEEEIRNARKGIVDEDNTKVACFLRCVLRKTNFMNEKGKITPDKALANLALGSRLRNRIEKEFTECSKVDDTDTCKKALKIYQCAYQKFSRHPMRGLF